MERPIELKGVIQGKTITLDEVSFLPDGYRVTLHLILKPGEVFKLVARAGVHMTSEEIADVEQTMSEAMGYPFKMPEVGPYELPVQPQQPLCRHPSASLEVMSHAKTN